MNYARNVEAALYAEYSRANDATQCYRKILKLTPYVALVHIREVKRWQRNTRRLRKYHEISSLGTVAARGLY